MKDIEEQFSQPRLRDLITADTSPDEFEEIVGQILTEDNKEALGTGAKHKTTKALLYTTSFRPGPATFDRDAFRNVACLDDKGKPLPDEQVDELIQLCKRLGVFEEKGPRFSIEDTQIHNTLRSILSKYD